MAVFGSRHCLPASKLSTKANEVHPELEKDARVAFRNTASVTVSFAIVASIRARYSPRVSNSTALADVLIKSVSNLHQQRDSN